MGLKQVLSYCNDQVHECITYVYLTVMYTL